MGGPALWVSRWRGTPKAGASESQCLCKFLMLRFSCSSLLMCLESKRMGNHVFDPWYPHWSTVWGFWLLASTWTSQSHYDCLGHVLGDERILFCFSIPLSGKFINLFKIIKIEGVWVKGSFLSYSSFAFVLQQELVLLNLCHIHNLFHHYTDVTDMFIG